MPEPNPKLNGQIFYVPGQPEIYWIDNGLARHIPDEATYQGVFGGSPNKQAYSALLTDVSLGQPIADGTELVRAGDDAEIYFVEKQTKRWIPTETIKAEYQLNGDVHSQPLATVNSYANGPAFVDTNPPPTPPAAPSGLLVISKQADAGSGASSITIGWTDNADNEAGFNITYDGSLPGSPDDKGKKTVSSNSTTATISGLTSGYTYVIEVQSFNAGGNGGIASITVGIPYVAPQAPRAITVSKQGTGSAASAIVSGSGFTPNSLIVIRIVAANLLNPVQFSTTAGADGKFSASKSFSCVSGIVITFTAFEDANPTGTISNAVSLTC
jgi:Fibronectin type III domain